MEFEKWRNLDLQEPPDGASVIVTDDRENGYITRATFHAGGSIFEKGFWKQDCRLPHAEDYFWRRLPSSEKFWAILA